MSSIKVKEGYYWSDCIGDKYHLVLVMYVTAEVVWFKIVINTMYYQWPFFPGTIHEVPRRTFVALYHPYPTLKGMLLDGSDNE